MTEQQPFKPRRILLGIVGVVETLIGLFFALIGFIAFTSNLVSALKRTDAEFNLMGFIGAVILLAIAACFTSVGIGTIMARRWARALGLIAAWCWLFIGVSAVTQLIFFPPPSPFPVDSEAYTAQQAIAPIMTLFMAVLYILIPALVIWVYSLQSVRTTCETVSPQSCWTDKVPLPVLALVILLVFGAILAPAFMLLYSTPVTFFWGALITGAPALLITFFISALTLLTARYLYRLDMRAWYAALLIVLFSAASTILSGTPENMAKMYELLPQTLQTSQKLPTDFFSSPLFSVACSQLGMFVYLAWIRKFFVRTKA